MKVSKSFWLDEETINQLEKIVKKEEYDSLSSLVRKIIKEYLKK